MVDFLVSKTASRMRMKGSARSISKPSKKLVKSSASSMVPAKCNPTPLGPVITWVPSGTASSAFARQTTGISSFLRNPRTSGRSVTTKSTNCELFSTKVLPITSE